VPGDGLVNACAEPVAKPLRVRVMSTAVTVVRIGKDLKRARVSTFIVTSAFGRTAVPHVLNT
jgi:hypothetical protein